MEWLQWLFGLLFEQRETFLRLCLAGALGALVGLEREVSGKPAGFRTNLLICLGAALITELSRYVALDGTTGQFRSDPGRIAAQIVSGIGFLGAGTIMQARGNVTGLTTAATLWVVAAIGMAVGAGAYGAALLTTGIVVFALWLLFRLEGQMGRHRPSDRTVEVVLAASGAQLGRVEELLAAGNLKVLSVSVSRDDNQLTAVFQTRGAYDRYPQVVHTLMSEPGMRQVSLL